MENETLVEGSSTGDFTKIYIAIIVVLITLG